MFCKMNVMKGAKIMFMNYSHCFADSRVNDRGTGKNDEEQQLVKRMKCDCIHPDIKGIIRPFICPSGEFSCGNYFFVKCCARHARH